jgi:hypothetical protein
MNLQQFLLLVLCCATVSSAAAATTQGDVLRAGLPQAVVAKLGWTSADYCKWTGVTCLKRDVLIVALKNKKISAPLPAAWATLPQLAILALQGNAFFGPLPPAWGQLKKILELYLQDNLITGTVPKAWANMNGKEQIGYIFLDNNKALGGCLPWKKNDQSEVYLATYSGTKITGFCY